MSRKPKPYPTRKCGHHTEAPMGVMKYYCYMPGCNQTHTTAFCPICFEAGERPEIFGGLIKFQVYADERRAWERATGKKWDDHTVHKPMVATFASGKQVIL